MATARKVGVNRLLVDVNVSLIIPNCKINAFYRYLYCDYMLCNKQCFFNILNTQKRVCVNCKIYISVAVAIFGISSKSILFILLILISAFLCFDLWNASTILILSFWFGVICPWWTESLDIFIFPKNSGPHLIWTFNFFNDSRYWIGLMLRGYLCRFCSSALFVFP